MQCPRCHAENREGRRFCGECGLSLALTCPSCRFVNEGGEKFCGGCGAPVASFTAAPQGRFGPPETYTPKHLAERILTSKAALEGERKQVTVLFADLKGSMELLADRDPEEARELLDPVLEHMMEAVHRYEGTVNQVMGDGIMALFGAPLAHEDHAVRACYAALRMQESVKRYAEGVFRSYGVTVRIRVGLNSGEVVVRAIGSDLHMDYTAVGQTTHLAARMEQLADPGTTLLTSAVLQLAEGYVEVKTRGGVPVKGLSEPVEVYDLVGAGAARSRLHASVARGLSRFVGRDNELDQLRGALERAASGRGQVVAVVGEPGVGKSRLYWELTHSHRTQAWQILETGAASYGKATPYLAVIELLKVYFQIDGRDDSRKIREKITGKVLSLDRRLEPSLPALLALLDVPPEEAEWEQLDPSQRRQLTLDGVKRLLLRESQVQPLIVLFEDLHWIDGETQALLDSLVESLPTTRLLLLVNYRPEYQHGWGGKTFYRQLRLDPLPAESADDLLAGLLGTDASLDPLRRALIERTEGNPLFLEESVRMLVETRMLIGARGAYRAAPDSQTVKVPATVQAILAARIDRLSAEDKRLLQAASAVGKDVPFAVLHAIAELSDDQCRQGLTRLQAAEFLYEARLFPDLEYTFKHALTHEVAYGSLLQDRRRTLHARIVEAIERLFPERLNEQVERLAHHALRGEEWEKAFAYLRRAGAKAADRLALREAEAYLEQAAAAVERLPRRRDLVEQSIDLRMELRAVLFPLSEFERVRDHLSRAAMLAGEVGDRPRLGRIAALQAHYHCIIAGDMAQALECARRAMAIAETAAIPSLTGVTRFTLGQVQHARGDYLEAIETLETNIQFLAGELDQERGGLALPISLISRVWLVFALAEVGRFTEAVAIAEQATERAEAVAHPYSLYHAYWSHAVLCLGKGEHERAANLEIQIRRFAGTYPSLRHNVAGLLGYAHTLAGRSSEALVLLEGVVFDPAPRNAFTARRDTSYLAETYLGAGRLDDALRTTRSALELARASHQRGNEAHALRLLGNVLAARGEDGQAEKPYREALALAEPRSMRPLVAHCHLGLAGLYQGTGAREQAHQHLTTATTMYREMDMTYWLERAKVDRSGSS
jgi:class 3 adenylate cyclase/tetratricopeptide (TPR) repeat protein